jgi:transposase InsO family protein
VSWRQLLRGAAELGAAIAGQLKLQPGDLGLGGNGVLRHRRDDLLQRFWVIGEDVSYIPMAKGFLYLVVIMDWVSRAVLAWRLSNTLGTEFCVDALEDELARHRPTRDLQYRQSIDQRQFPGGLTAYRDVEAAYRITFKSLARRYLELHDEIADLDIMIGAIVDGSR